MKKNLEDIWFDYTITITLPDGKEKQLRVWKNKFDGRELIAGPDAYKGLGMSQKVFNNSFPYPKVEDKSLVLLGRNEYRSVTTAFYLKEDVVKYIEDRCSYLNWELTYQTLPNLGTVRVWKNKIDGREVIAGPDVYKGFGMNVSTFNSSFPYSKVEDKSLVLLGQNEFRSVTTAFYLKEDVVKFAEDRYSYLNWESSYQPLPYLGTVRVWKNKIDGRELIAKSDAYKGLGMSQNVFNNSFPYPKVDDKSLVLLSQNECGVAFTAFYRKEDVVKFAENNNKNFLYYFIFQRTGKESKYRVIKIGKTTQPKRRFETHDKVFDIEERYLFRVENCDEAEKELKKLLKSYSVSKRHPEDKVLLGDSEMYTIEALSTVEDIMSRYTQVDLETLEPLK